LNKLSLALIIGFTILFSSCTSIVTKVKNQQNLNEKKTVYLNISNDTYTLRNEISEHLESLGFISEQQEKANIIVKVKYKTVTDLVHETFDYYEMTFEDRKNGEILLRTRYSGGINTSNSLQQSLKLIFIDIKKELNKN
jgi:hypothetical protein